MMNQKKSNTIRIDLEAHFYTGEYLKYLRARQEAPREESFEGALRLWYTPAIWEPHGGIDERLCDLGEGRLEAMDEAGIAMQVLSLSAPGCEQFSPADGTALARETNDALSRAVKRYPDRFIGLAALAPQSPEMAAAELERAVGELGLKGAKLHSHVGSTYLDDQKYRVIFKKAAELDVPLYLHPTIPDPAMMKAYTDGGFALAGPPWGFGAEASMQAIRLIYSGVFDEYPNLKIILGHLGEGLVFWMNRIDFAFTKPWMAKELQPKIKKLPSDYVRENFVITNGGMFAVPAFMSVFMELGPDRMMFATDYPYENSEDSVRFMESVPISDVDRKKIFHRNAEKLFNL